MAKTGIAVIGSNMIDLTTYIERMPKEGETVVAPDFDMGFGGKGANQAVAAALLDAEVVMVSRIGGDIFGTEVKKNFEKYGIDTTFVEESPGVSNGVAPIFVDKSGSNSILIVKGANDHLRPEDVDRAAEKIVECGLILLQLEIPLDTVYHAIEFGKSRGITVVLNPAPAAALDFRCVAGVDLLIPNETELETLTGMPNRTMDEIERAALSLVEKGVGAVIVTLGKQGSLLVRRDDILHVPGIMVNSRDTTGAGDAFIGCFARSLVETEDMVEAMRLANIYAALSTLRCGTQKSFYTRDEFEAFRKGASV